MSDDVRPPVEPMSDLSWARVERGLWARLDGTQASGDGVPRSRRWLWFAVPSVAAAGAIAATFTFVVGGDPPKRDDAPRVAAPAVGDETPTRIVSSDSPSTITLGDVHVTLDAHSAVVMPRNGRAGATTAVLDRGAAWFSVDRPFVVMAGDTVVRVIGTKFRVVRYEEYATVEVERGVVEISYRGSTTKLGAGEQWSSRPPSAEPAEPATIDPPKHARPASKKTVATSDEREQYERMSALEPRDPERAIAGYLEIARGSSAFAAMSLFAAARLAEERGNPERAMTLANAYLRRFPGGRNAEDARQLLDRLKGAR